VVGRAGTTSSTRQGSMGGAAGAVCGARGAPVRGRRVSLRWGGCCPDAQRTGRSGRSVPTGRRGRAT